MSYETAPATKMLATRCACCSRPLLDTVSVESGVGPDCRKKYGYGSPQQAPDWNLAVVLLDSLMDKGLVLGEKGTAALSAQDAHGLSNALVHYVACEQKGANVAIVVATIRALGWHNLSTCIAERIGSITVTEEKGNFLVKAPYSEAFNMKIARVTGPGSWDKVRKVRVVPVRQRRALWGIIKATFGGRGMLCNGAVV